MNAISKFIGSTVCAVAFLFAVGQVSAANLVLNPGFETAGANPSLAANWTTDTAAGGPVYGIRTNDNPHSGSFNYEVLLASIGAGPVVQFNQSAIPVTGGSVYTFSFYSDRLAGSQGDSDQWRILWNAGGDTGYHSFTPGANTYALFSTSVTAPATATSATIFFHGAGPAIPAQSATVDFDDVSLTTVPEPMTVTLVGLGLLGAVALGRKRKS